MSHPIPSFVQVHRLFEAKVRRRFRFDRVMLDPAYMSLLLLICYVMLCVVMNLVVCVRSTDYAQIMYYMT